MKYSNGILLYSLNAGFNNGSVYTFKVPFVNAEYSITGSHIQYQDTFINVSFTKRTKNNVTIVSNSVVGSVTAGIIAIGFWK